MESENLSAKFPPNVQKEIRSKLGAIGIKVTIAAERLQAETDAARAAQLREEIAALKAEAKSVVDLYRSGKSIPAEAPRAGAPSAADSNDGIVVFGDLVAPAASAPPPARPPSVEPAFGLDAGDVPLVVDLVGVDPNAIPPVFGEAAIESGSGLLDEVAFSLTLLDEAEATRERAARGGRLGLGLGLAAELAAGREAEWGGPLLAAALETTALALSAGADEEEAAAAVLFETIDLSTEEVVLQEIRSLLGDRVVELVAWSAWMLRVDPWEQRDRAYMARFQTAPASSVFVSLAGRVVSGRAMSARRKAAGTGSLDRPGRERERLVWSLRALVKAYRSITVPPAAIPLLDEWEAAVEAIAHPRPPE
jgi:hypothetical protein